MNTHTNISQIAREGQQSTTRTKKVVIVGAGPAGLLASILFLRRNINQETPKYQVTLVDPGTNYGKLDAEGLQRKRSWMIGLSTHGLTAIRSVDGLYENYVRGLGIDIEHVVIGLSKGFKIEKKASEVLEDDSAFTVDRNFICAALAKYLNERYDSDASDENKGRSKMVTVTSRDGVDVEKPELCQYYDTRALFIDYDNKQVLVRDEKGSREDMYLDYDLIIGCDGIRSIVRNAIASTNRNFEFSISDTFGVGKAFHIDCPPEVKDGTFFFLRNAVPHMSSFTLPETGRKLNVNLGVALNELNKIDPVLKSDDVDAISAYFKKHFHAFKMDCDDAAKQWVSQGWNTISQVHCNIYHDSKRMILLMGDAAHATSPQIGQGMNTALADAAALDKMLDSHKDDLAAALETFSKERVKEGNALTDLSFHTFSLSSSRQLSMMIGQNIRRKLNRMLPMFFPMDPMDEVDRGGKLSTAYDKMNKLGIIKKTRAINDTIIREHFEQSCGMTTPSKASTNFVSKLMVIGMVTAVSVVSLPGLKDMTQSFFC
jgi:kynurenine 3-monooxygenase